MIKYAKAVHGKYDVLAAIIHPIWVIEENAIIDFIFVWVMPIIPPIITFMIEITIINFVNCIFMKVYIIIDSGAIFWMVLRIKHDHQEIDDITDGNHIWHGAIPSFIIIAVIIIMVINHDVWLIHISLVDRRSRLEPSAWIRKYLIIASDSWKLEVLIISGINDNIFSSRPIHINNQLLEDKTIITDDGRSKYISPLIKILDIYIGRG